LAHRQGYKAVLNNKPFVALWLAQIFSQLGDRVCFVVFVAIIAHNIGTSTSYQSWLYVSFTIPAILVTALAGVFIDRWSKKLTLIISNILRAMIILILPVVDSTLTGIYAIAFLVSMSTQFFVPAEASAIPMLVEKKQLIAANSLFTTTMMGSVIFGFVLGDPLINMFGINTVHFAITGLFLISTVFLLGIVEKEPEHGHNRTMKEFFEEFKEGLIYIKETPIIFNAMLKLATLFSIIVALCILSISISSQMLYPENPARGAQKFAYIVAYSGLGMVLGSYLMGKYWRTRSKLIAIFSGFTTIGISLCLLSLTALIPNDLRYQFAGVHFLMFDTEPFELTVRMIYTYFIASVTGFGSALVAIPVMTILQSSIPENMRGKVFGVQFTLLSTSSTLPVILVAFGADFLGVIQILLIAGIPLTIFGIYGFYNIWKKL
jgi:MFS family permease